MVTGLGCVGPFGLGGGPLAAALAAGSPLGEPETVATLRGRSRRVRVARILPFDRERHLPARTLRRMGDVSQIWTIVCLLARAEAGLDEGDAAAYPPARRGTFMGTGFGCIDSTWEYLTGMVRDPGGATSPFLFSESVANAPAGHSAIVLDTRGASVSLTCGDASAAVAVRCAAVAIRSGRIDVAYCGGIEMMVDPLLRVLASLGSLSFVSEGAVCLVLEDRDRALARGAAVLAELSGWGLLSDPAAPPAGWSRDASRHRAAMRRALDGAGPTARVYLHGPPDEAAAAAQASAALAEAPHAERIDVTSVTGDLGAAGGFPLAAAVLSPGSPGHGRGDALVCGSSWGGTLACLRLSPP